MPLYIMLAYLMLPTALFNAVCMMLVYLFRYLALDFCIVIVHSNSLCFHALSLDD